MRFAYDAHTGLLDVRVRDTGPGIHPHDLPHIFGMFQQAKSDTGYGGVGLGLYIVKRFVEQLGGEVGVSSDLGKGSSFSVSVPAGALTLPSAEDQHRRDLVA